MNSLFCYCQSTGGAGAGAGGCGNREGFSVFAINRGTNVQFNTTVNKSEAHGFIMPFRYGYTGTAFYAFAWLEGYVNAHFNLLKFRK